MTTTEKFEMLLAQVERNEDYDPLFKAILVSLMQQSFELGKEVSYEKED